MAVDRAIKISNLIQRGKSVDKWIALRDEIRHDIITHAWHNGKQAFTQSYHSEHLDASVLLMEYYGFIDGKDEKYIQTVKAIEKELMYDYCILQKRRRFWITSSSFTVCTFWFINSLFQLERRNQKHCLMNCFRIAIIWGYLVRILILNLNDFLEISRKRILIWH